MLLKICQIIVWDECTMSHKKAFEALDRTLKDVRHSEKLMGGALILLSGDFRQTLPVINRGTMVDEIDACLKQSFIWNYVHILKLIMNMRAFQNESYNEFAKTLLEIGEKKIDYSKENEISFPSHFCHLTKNVNEIIDNVYPDLAINYQNDDWLFERAILSPKNDNVNHINNQILMKLPGNNNILIKI